MLLGSGGGAASGAAIAIVDTAGAGGFWIPTVFDPEDSATTAIFAASSVLRLCQFTLPFRATVSKVTIEVTTLQAATIAAFGIYDSVGGKLIDSGTFDMSTTGFKQNSFTATTLEPGVYYCGWAADGTTTRCRVVTSALTSIAGNFINQGTASRRCSAANAMVGGVLPTTLGTLTDLSALDCTLSYWET